MMRFVTTFSYKCSWTMFMPPRLPFGCLPCPLLSPLPDSPPYFRIIYGSL